MPSAVFMSTVSVSAIFGMCLVTLLDLDAHIEIVPLFKQVSCQYPSKLHLKGNTSLELLVESQLLATIGSPKAWDFQVKEVLGYIVVQL